MFLAARGWNSEDYAENCSEGFISEWISYFKRMSFMILILSATILYYIPESRIYAKRTCCFMIDNFAKGLKTVLCLKENENVLHNKKTYYIDTLESEIHNPKLYKSNHLNFENTKVHKYEEDIRREKSKKNLESLKHNLSKKSISGQKNRLHRRNEKSKCPTKSSLKLSEDYENLISSVNYEPSESGIEYSIPDESIESFAGYSIGNHKSFFISGNPRQMALLDEKEDDNIIVPKKICPIKPKYEEKNNHQKLHHNKKKTISRKELQKPTESLIRVISAAETVILNESRLKSIPAAENLKKVQWNNESNNKTTIFYERTPRLKEAMNELNAEIKYKENAEKSNEMSPKIEEYEGFNGVELLSELGNQINKLDLAIKMMRPSSKYEIKENGDTEAYPLQTIEAILKDIKKGFQKYDKGVKNRQKSRISKKLLSKENKQSKSIENIENDLFEYENDVFVDKTSKKLDRKKMIVLEENDIREEGLRKVKNEEIIAYEDDEEDDSIPVLTNRFKPILSRTIDWLFGGCPDAKKIKSAVEEFNPDAAKLEALVK